MPDLESHWLAEKLAFLGRSLSGGVMWARRVWVAVPRLAANLKAEDRREVLFLFECRKVLRKLLRLFQSRKELYRELVVGTVSDPLVERLG